MYYSYQVGANRNYTDSQGLDSVHDLWASFMAPALSNSYTSFVDGNDYPTYSDLIIGGAHGNGYTIGGGPRGLFGIQYLSDTFTPPTLQSWLQNPLLAATGGEERPQYGLVCQLRFPFIQPEVQGRMAKLIRLPASRMLAGYAFNNTNA